MTREEIIIIYASYRLLLLPFFLGSVKITNFKRINNYNNQQVLYLFTRLSLSFFLMIIRTIFALLYFLFRLFALIFRCFEAVNCKAAFHLKLLFKIIVMDCIDYLKFFLNAGLIKLYVYLSSHRGFIYKKFRDLKGIQWQG